MKTQPDITATTVPPELGGDRREAPKGGGVGIGQAQALPLDVRWMGSVAYTDALDMQQSLVSERRAGRIPDQLLLLEHPHVITLGTSSAPQHVLLPAEERALLGIEIYETGRGGDVTYHGPGQLVGYPILDLKPDRCDLHRYVRDIEEALILALRDLALEGYRKEGLTGVWVNERKIAAIGVRVSSGWITSHGFALNVSTDLRFFESIVPCGITDYDVTSIERELGVAPPMQRICDIVSVSFAQHFGRTIR